MQNEFMENWSKLTQCMTKPLIEMTELNLSTMSNFAKNASVLQVLSQAKKPEDLMAAQVKLAHLASLTLTDYAQKAMEIGLCAVAETNKVCVETFNKTSSKTSEFVHKTAESAKTDTTSKRK